MPALNHLGNVLDEVSDAVDDVNVLKGKLWNEESEPVATKDKNSFRQYDSACERVKAFYKEQHEKQTVAFNIKARVDFKSRKRARMSIWQAMEMLNTLVDDSDPDVSGIFEGFVIHCLPASQTSLSQIDHLLQTAEAIRRDGKPEWMQVTGLIHDLGKLLYFFGSEGQWDVVGDTFVVGCAFSDKNIYPETFVGNPDNYDAVYSTKCGIYEAHCGLDNVMLSWGHDERIGSWHREGAYTHLTNAKDVRALEAVRAFNPYDLYSKCDEPVNAEKLRPYYENLIAKFFPPELDW
ncbi:DUF706-domain-containing protein [Butyriboletus roseoflavus]|nr:DUF706-domain-containing protein [Butyriboletus roseoflavus]